MSSSEIALTSNEIDMFVNDEPIFTEQEINTFSYELPERERPVPVIVPIFPIVRPNLPSPFTYAGSKARELTHILKYIPQQFDHYVEPFVGGGSLFFHLNHNKNVVSDLSQDTANMYHQIHLGNLRWVLDNLKKVGDWIQATQDPTTLRNMFFSCRDEFNTLVKNDPAKRFSPTAFGMFYSYQKWTYYGWLKFTCDGFLGSTTARNKPSPTSRIVTTQKLEKHFSEYEDLLKKRTKVYCETYETIIQKYDNPSNFIFFDPPYDQTSTSNSLYNVPFSHAEHFKLATYFKQSDAKCLMILKDTQFIRDLYKEYIVDTYQTKYGNAKNPTVHLVIKNYAWN